MKDLAFLQHWLIRIADVYKQDYSPVGNDVETMNHVENMFLNVLSRGRQHGPHESPWVFSRALQTWYALRKWKATILPAGELRRAAVEGFIARNATVGDRTVVDANIRNRMRRLLTAWLPSVDETTDSRGNRDMILPTMGPGAVAERFDFLDKRRLMTCYAEGFWGDPPSEGATLAEHQCARLCAVPKQWNKLRLITVEPYCSTFDQQFARSYIWRSMMAGPLARIDYWRRFWTNAQTVQRKRALSGSRNSRTATVDLSDASDGISYDLVASVFPAHVMALLDRGRSVWFQEGDTRHSLNIYAGMGNATTFIVETLLFFAYVEAVKQSVVGFLPTTVFGDDIICDSRLVEYGLLDRFRNGAFFQVNHNKSFWGSMPLRESCGLYAYAGHEITPFKVSGYDLSVNEEQVALADLYHRIWLRSEFPGSPEDQLCSWIRDTSGLPTSRHYSPNMVSLYVGPSTDCSMQQDKLRINRSLQRLEQKVRYLMPKTRLFYEPTEGWPTRVGNSFVACSNIAALRTETAGLRARSRRYLIIPSRGSRFVEGWLPVQPLTRESLICSRVPQVAPGERGCDAG